jgi:hypothetical protein
LVTNNGMTFSVYWFGPNVFVAREIIAGRS